MPDQYDLLVVMLHEQFDLVLEASEVAVALFEVGVAQAPILRDRGRVEGVKVDAIDAKGPLRDSDKRA